MKVKALSSSKHRPKNNAYWFIGLLLILSVLIGLPSLIHYNPFYLSLATEILIFGLAVMGMDVLLGYTGLVPFGHAAYFGTAAYIAAFSFIYIDSSSLWLAIFLGMGTSVLVSLLIGWLMVRLGGISFALVSMAFGQILFTIFWKARTITKGDDGLILPSRPEIAIGNWVIGSTGNFTALYFFTLATVIICFLFTWKVMNSPYGAALQAIRENEKRASFIGLNVNLYKLGAFALACALASMAGILFLLLRGQVVPSFLHWSNSGSMIIMNLIGGRCTLWGPFIGSCVLIFAKDYISTMTEHWMLPLGLTVILIIFFARRGLAGLMGSRGGREIERSLNSKGIAS